MTESAFTQTLLRPLRLALASGAVLKLADNYTAGVPDFFVALNGRTRWYEVKLAVNRRWYEPIQLGMLKRLHGSYIIYDTTVRRGAVFAASWVMDERRTGLPNNNFDFTLSSTDIVRCILADLEAIQ